MRLKNFKFASSLVGAALTLGVQASSALAQPSGHGPIRVSLASDASSDDVAGAREVVAVMYHGESDADTQDWLFERLMDRYRRAFDLFDGVDDSEVQQAKNDVLKSLQPRLHGIVDPRVPALRAGAVQTIAMQWRGDDMRTLRAFARTPAGKRYIEDFPMLDERNYFLRPALAPLVRDNLDLANRAVHELTERLGHRFTDRPEYAEAIVAAASQI